MNDKTLESWAKHIGTEVPYSDYRAAVTDAVVNMAKKTRRSFTDLDERKFRNRCIYWETFRR